MRLRPRRLLVSISIGLPTIAALYVVLNWGVLGTAFYLYRARTSPAYWESLISAPSGTQKREALIDLLSTDAGLELLHHKFFASVFSLMETRRFRSFPQDLRPEEVASFSVAFGEDELMWYFDSPRDPPKWTLIPSEEPFHSVTGLYLQIAVPRFEDLSSLPLEVSPGVFHDYRINLSVQSNTLVGSVRKRSLDSKS